MEYVGVGRRAVAVIIDGIILGIVTGFLLGISAQTSGPGDPASAGISLTIWIVNLIIVIGYFTILEATLGATVGKLVMGIRVVKADGSKLDWGSSLIRNVVRIIDALFVYLLGAIFIWTSPMKQRLGDRAAGSVVVRAGTQVVTA